MPVENRSPLNVCIFIAIPEREQFRKVAYPLAQRMRSAARHALNRIMTWASGRLHLEIYHYMVARNLGDNSNRGDIAIRMAVREQLTAAFAPRPLIFTELGWGTLTANSVAEINKTCDLFVIGGGGYVFINGDGSAGAMLADIPHLAHLQCPVVAFGIGLNRLMHEEAHALDTLPQNTRESIKALSAACASISVRDRETLEMFDLHGDKPAMLVGDPVLFQHNPVSRLRRRDGRLSIGINLAGHGWRAVSVLKPLLPEIVGFLKTVGGRNDIDFVYLLHHDFERPIADYLRQQGLRIRVMDGGAMELLQAYGQLDLVICQMLHSCIFAANADVPFLNIAYDRKNIAFCALMDVSEYCVPHADANREILQQKFEMLLESRTRVASTIAERKNSLRPAFDHFLEQVAKTRPRPDTHH